MQVKVQYLGLIRDKLGKKEDKIEIQDDAILSDLLDQLSKTQSEQLKKLFEADESNVLDPTFIITVNGVLAGQLNGMKTKLIRGDKIALMTLISGG
jgi:MoaD family protein